MGSVTGTLRSVPRVRLVVFELHGCAGHLLEFSSFCFEVGVSAMLLCVVLEVEKLCITVSI